MPSLTKLARKVIPGLKKRSSSGSRSPTSEKAPSPPATPSKARATTPERKAAPPAPIVVLITGANQGLGLHAARQIAALPGYHVLLGARDAGRGREAAEKLNAEKPKSPVEFIQIEITSDESIAAAVKTVETKFGKLDVLVNNAGVNLELQGKAGLPTRQLMEETYEINVFGTATVAEAFLPLLEKSDFPRMVNVSSTLGSIEFQLTPDTGYPVEFLMVYNTSKTAVNSLTAHYSLKLKHKPGRVISICPGYNSTAMNGYTEGAQDPAIGAAAIVRGAIEGPESQMKTGSFWNDSGKPVNW